VIQMVLRQKDKSNLDEQKILIGLGPVGTDPVQVRLDQAISNIEATCRSAVHPRERHDG
jgi:hypothetical protein